MKISYHGVKTNNLKNINVSFQANKIIMVSGPSGSGKSSLVIDTIHSVSEDELFQLINLKEGSSKYILDHFENILPSVCLKQDNYNSNPRSTISTYFSLDRYFKTIYSELNGVSQSLFQFNSLATACPVCKGLGHVLTPDPLKIVDYSSRIRDIPFRCWRNIEKDYYKQVIALFCQQIGVDIEKQFSDLTANKQELLLCGISKGKYQVKFSSNGRKRSRKRIYQGPVFEINEELRKNTLPHTRKKYLSEAQCAECEGRRFSNELANYKVFGQSLGDLYMMETQELLKWIELQKNYWGKDVRINRSFQHILNFLKAMHALGLNYLHLNRSVPSLSGGELQRLRLSKSVITHFNNFLYILDEPTSGLHPSEWKLVFNLIALLKKQRNTVLLIEHNEALKALADKVICLGPSGGIKGGELVFNSKKQPGTNKLKYRFFEADKTIQVEEASANCIHNLSIKLPMNTIVGVCGVSGAGKSSFLQGILPRVVNNAVYFNQSAILGNSYSIVATAVNVLTKIQVLYTKKTGAPKDYFTFSSKGRGQCALCSGKGILEDPSSYIKDSLLCPDCKGKRFSSKALEYEYLGLNIHQFLSSDVHTLRGLLSDTERGIDDVLKRIEDVGLGYLNLFQNVSTLSGGEAQRIKLIDALVRRKGSEVYLLDEPFRGVDKSNIKRIMSHLYDLVANGSTIYIAEHNPLALSYCSYLIEFGPVGGSKGGKVIYNGKRCTVPSQALIASHLVQV